MNIVCVPKVKGKGFSIIFSNGMTTKQDVDSVFSENYNDLLKLANDWNLRKGNQFEPVEIVSGVYERLLKKCPEIDNQKGIFYFAKYMVRIEIADKIRTAKRKEIDEKDLVNEVKLDFLHAEIDEVTANKRLITEMSIEIVEKNTKYPEFLRLYLGGVTNLSEIGRRLGYNRIQAFRIMEVIRKELVTTARRLQNAEK